MGNTITVPLSELEAEATPKVPKAPKAADRTLTVSLDELEPAPAAKPSVELPGPAAERAARRFDAIAAGNSAMAQDTLRRPNPALAVPAPAPTAADTAFAQSRPPEVVAVRRRQYERANNPFVQEEIRRRAGLVGKDPFAHPTPMLDLGEVYEDPWRAAAMPGSNMISELEAQRQRELQEGWERFGGASRDRELAHKWEGVKLMTGAGGYPEIASGAEQIAAGGVKPGVTRVLRGAGEAMTPAIVLAGIGAPLRMASGVGLSIGAEEAAREVLEGSGATPEDVEFGSTLAGFAPLPIPTVKGVRAALQLDRPRFDSPLPKDAPAADAVAADARAADATDAGDATASPEAPAAKPVEARPIEPPKPVPPEAATQQTIEVPLAELQPAPEVRNVQHAQTAPEVKPAPEPGQVGTMRTDEIARDPHRFQYKLNTDAEGVGTLLKEQKVYNPDLAGVISVWRDPADGKMYVVNGHHRLELAMRTQHPEVTVRHIKAPTAEAARGVGALQNIAEGRGTPIDAAKFIRDSGYTIEELQAKGISLGEATAKKGIALSRLNDALFNKVVQGELREGRAVAIGEATADAAEQQAIFDLVQAKERKGQKVTDETLRELIRFVKGAGQETQSSMSLFGEEQVSKSLALEKAEVSAYILQQLKADKRLFGLASKAKNAERLSQVESNKLDVEQNKAVADQAAQAEAVYEKLSERAGPISSILDEAAQRLARGENAHGVKQDAYARIREEVQKTLSGGEGAGADRVQADPGRGSAAEPADTGPETVRGLRKDDGRPGEGGQSVSGDKSLRDDLASRTFRKDRRSGDYELVELDSRKLDDAWRRDRDYIPAGATTPDVMDRRAVFEKWLKQNPDAEVDVPLFYRSGEAVTVLDGRHRFSVIRDSGLPAAKVAVPSKDAAWFRERFGVSSGQGLQPSAPEVINQKTWYHGTGTAGLRAQDLDPLMTNIDNLFGSGIYLTDNAEIAGGYAKARSKRGGSPTIYKASVDVDKVVDLDAPVNPDALAAIKRQLDRSRDSSFYGEVVEYVEPQLERALKNPDVTTADVWRAVAEGVAEHSHGNRVPTYEYDDFFIGIVENLKAAGYDGFTHIGGKRTGSKPHQVLILFDPSNKLSSGAKQRIRSFDAVEQSKPIVSLDHLSPEQKQIEAQAQKVAIEREREIVDDYLRKNTREGVITVVSDDLKPYLPGWETVESRQKYSDAVHASSAYLGRKALEKALAQPVDPQRQHVDLITGMQGTGKSTMHEAYAAKDAGVVHETNLSDPARAKEVIEQVIASGRKPRIWVAYVKDPMEGFERAIKRAKNHGRTVQIESMASIYTRLPETMQALKAHYGDRLDITVGELTGRDPKPSSLDELQRIPYNGDTDGLTQAFRARLDELHGSGAINDDIYRGFLGQLSRVGSGVRGQLPQERRSDTPDAGSGERSGEVTRSLRRRPAGYEPLKGQPVALPGFEEVSKANETAAAERQQREMQDALSTPKQDISQKAAILERESPLFRDSEASGQKSLFGGEEPTRGFTGQRHLLPSVGQLNATPELISKRGILDRLSAKLNNLPIRFGHYRSRGAVGIYKVRSEAVRLKQALDIPTAAHEVGHHINKLLWGTKNGDLNWAPFKPFRSELSTIASTPRAGQSDLPEGFAEFVRMYLTDPAAAKKAAPKFHAFFEQELARVPELQDALLTTQQEIQRYIAQPAQAKILAHISKTDAPGKGNRWDRLYTYTMDALTPIRRTVDALSGGQKVPTERNAYELARLMAGWAGKAEHFLKHGTFDPKTLKITGKPLQEILKPMEGRLDDLRIYLVAKRTQEKFTQGVETGIDIADANDAVAKLDSPEMQQVAKELYEYNDAMLDYLEKSGVLSAEQLKSIKDMNRNYVPFFRVAESDPKFKFRSGKTMVDLWAPVKRMKGSGREIIDPLESIIKNTYQFINMAERNKVGLALARQAAKTEGSAQWIEEVAGPMKPTSFELAEVKKQLEAAGADLSKADLETVATVFRPSALAPKGENILTVIDDGKRRFFQVQPELYNALKALDEEQSNILIRMLSAPASLLRLGATSLSDTFVTRNPMRDTVTAFLQSQNGFKPGVDTFRGLFHAVKRDELYWEWKRAGGDHAAMVSLDRKVLQEGLRDLMRSKTAYIVRHPVEALRILSEYSEAATRLGEYQRAKGKGKSPTAAAMDAREVTLDFARVGAKTKAVNQIIAFWNAAVQGADKFVRTHRENPKGTIAKAMAGITLPSLILYALNRDDEDYKELPRWQKDFFWLIPTRGIPALHEQTAFIRIPKPILWGQLYGSLPERVLEWIDERDPAAFDEFGKNLLESSAPSMIPTAAVPLIEAWANKSFFTGRQIVPSYLDDLPAEHQAAPYTSEFAKQTALGLAKVGIEVSPMILENTLFGWTGSMGRTVLHGADAALGGKGKNEPADRGLHEVPFVRAFTVRTGAYQTKSVQKMLNRLDELKRKQNLVEFARKNPGAGEAEPLQAGEIAELRRLEGAQKQMRALTKRVRVIERDVRLDGAAKRKQIAAIESQIVAAAKSALGRPRASAAQLSGVGR
jgi:hypothetical protein